VFLKLSKKYRFRKCSKTKLKFVLSK